MNYFLILYLFLVVISPFFSFISLLFAPYVFKSTPKMFIFIGALIPGLMLMNKVPAGDLVRYLEWNTYAIEMGILDFLQFMHWREVGYLLLAFSISNIPFYGENIYVFLVVFISYYLILYSVYLICRYLKVNPNLVIIFFLSIVLFGPMLSLSTQIIRQFLSSSFLMLFFALSISSGRYKWPLIVTSILFHYSALFFLPLIFLTRYSYKAIFIWSIIIYSCFFWFSDVLIGIPYIGNIIIDRIITLKGHELNALTSGPYIIIFSLIVSAVFVIFKSTNQMLLRLCYVAILLSLFVFFMSIFSISSELATRYFFFIYFFLILLIPFVISEFSNKYLLYLAVFSVAVLSFVNSIIFGVWEYVTILTPFFSILILWS
jgi:hypothetical protein